MVKNEKVEIMSVPFLNLTRNDCINTVSERLKSNGQTIIFTPNPQMLLKAKKDASMQKLLQCADISLPDGSGIILASKILRTPLREQICGIDLAEDILSIAAQKGLSVFLLGGKLGRADAATANLKRNFPTLNICGSYHGYFEKQGIENQSVIERIFYSKPDIIFVCFGCPQQESWILQNVPSFPFCKLAMGLGGSIDVWSGHLRRAPRLFQRMHLEWLWRAVREPRRLRIFWDIPSFLIAILKHKKQRASRKATRP